MIFTKSIISAAFAALLLAFPASAADDPAAIEAEWKAAIENATRITTAPRMEGANAEKGEGLLEAFGTRYMPNAYAAYQKARETAKEREQLLRENFPNGRESDSTGGGLYDKVAKSTARAVAEMLRHHDELCHFFVLHRAGGVTDEQLSEIDAEKISVWLPEESWVIVEEKKEVLSPTSEELTFAAKYLPEIHKANQTLRNDLEAAERDYAALRTDAIAMDAARTWDIFRILVCRLFVIREQINDIATLLKKERLLHTVGERTSEQLANIDREKSLAILESRKAISTGSWVRNFFLNWINDGMVKVGGPYYMGKTEVTQMQWMAVMGNNPSKFQGGDNPVENISWNDCQEFLKLFNMRPEAKKSGFVFRLPTQECWYYACNAGATGKGSYCKLSDGMEIKEDTLGRVAWFMDNSDKKTHSVGQKEPNAFGLYDMNGNVWEWTQTIKTVEVFDHRMSCGGSWDESAEYCQSGSGYRGKPDDRSNDRGFRLCAIDVKFIEEAVVDIVTNMVSIPGKSFRMGKTEVTQRQWEAVMGETPSKFFGWSHPVEKVSLEDCLKFVELLNSFSEVKKAGLVFRLPTEEEWKYSCHAGATGGTKITHDTLDRVAWYGENSDEKTHPVGQKEPNAFGLYDMFGNVEEWTQTKNDNGTFCICGGGAYKPAFNPSGIELDNSEYDFYRSKYLGFRLCADVREK